MTRPNFAAARDTGTNDGAGVAVRAEIEHEVRRLCNEGAFVPATVMAIRAYGPEMLGFLVAQHHSGGDADEVFSAWSERVFRGLPAFAWACSLRTWAYTLARNASINFARGRKARARVERAANSEEIVALEQQIRTETPAFLRTKVRDKFAAIREALPPEDRILLVLRVDKRLEWKDLARVMLGEDGDLGDASLAKEAQRLRKQFQSLKARLVEAAKRAGMLDEGESS